MKNKEKIIRILRFIFIAKDKLLKNKLGRELRDILSLEHSNLINFKLYHFTLIF